MREKKLTVKINKSAKDIYNFYINPKNTPLWLDFIVKEETSDWPIKVGTTYKNQNKNGKWAEYIVTALEPTKLFELASIDGNYHVRYTHRPIDANSSELEYFEWIDHGNLAEPFTQALLEKLRKVVESL